MAVPFTGSFLLMAMLVIGVAVPTPGAVGGFHEATPGRSHDVLRRAGSTPPSVPPIVLARLQHRCPSLLLGLAFAAQEGLNFSRMRQLADHRRAEPVRP